MNILVTLLTIVLTAHASAATELCVGELAPDQFARCHAILHALTEASSCSKAVLDQMAARLSADAAAAETLCPHYSEFNGDPIQRAVIWQNAVLGIMDTHRFAGTAASCACVAGSGPEHDLRCQAHQAMLQLNRAAQAGRIAELLAPTTRQDLLSYCETLPTTRPDAKAVVIRVIDSHYGSGFAYTVPGYGIPIPEADR